MIKIITCFSKVYLIVLDQFAVSFI